MFNNLVTNKFKLFLKIFTSKFPLKGPCYFLVSDLKIQKALLYCPKVWKIIRSQDFFLDNGKIDFNLVKPAGMDGQMNSNSVCPTLRETINKGLPSMRRSIVDNPENPFGCSVRGLRHHLVRQSVKRFNPTLLFTPSKDFCPVNIPGGKIRPGPTTDILMFYSHRLSRTWRRSGMFANSGLDARFFIRTDDIVIWPQRLTFPLLGVKIKHFSRFFNEIGISGINPGSVEPRSNRILMQPSPDARIAYGRNNGGRNDLPDNFSDTESA